MGVAKTHEVWLDFRANDAAQDRAVQVARQANTPVLAAADPRWNCASRALGPLHLHDPDGFPHVEAALEAMLDRFTYWEPDGAVSRDVGRALP